MKFNKVDASIARMAESVIKEEFPDLQHLKILYCFRSKAKPGEDGLIIAGTARILPPKLQDLWEFHAEIELAEPIWEAMTPVQRKRLIWHELRHLKVETDEDGQPVLNREGRIHCWCEEHDCVVKTFSEEILKFGINHHDLKVMKAMHKAYVLWKRGKLKLNKRLMVGDAEVSFG